MKEVKWRKRTDVNSFLSRCVNASQLKPSLRKAICECTARALDITTSATVLSVFAYFFSVLYQNLDKGNVLLSVFYVHGFQIFPTQMYRRKNPASTLGSKITITTLSFYHLFMNRNFFLQDSKDFPDSMNFGLSLRL